MALKENNTECLLTCWGIAALVGFVAMVMLYGFAEFSALQAIFTGGLAGTILGGILSLTVCTSQTAAQDLASDNKPAMRYAAEAAARKAEMAGATSAPSPVAAADTAAAGSAGVAAGSAGVAAGSAGVVAGSAGSSSAGVSASATSVATSVGGPEAGTVDADAQDTTAPAGNMAAVNTTPSAALSIPAADEAAAKPAPTAKAAPKAKAAPNAKAAPKAKAAAETKAAAAPTAAADGTPEIMLSAARPEGKDDLKRISGVGPKLEQTLNDLGIYHFDQVAKFDKKDIAWVDARLRFKGRIERDDWMSQAKILAEGGETEFSKRSKKT